MLRMVESKGYNCTKIDNVSTILDQCESFSNIDGFRFGTVSQNWPYNVFHQTINQYLK